MILVLTLISSLVLNPLLLPETFQGAHFFFLKYDFIYLFMAVLGLRCCTGFSLFAGSRGSSSLRCVGLPLR